MVRILIFLSFLLSLTASNAYAWYCNFSSTPQGWYQDNSMVCYGIDVAEALQQHYCGWFKPSDPYCSIYQQPSCTDSVETRSGSCPLPHYSGAINQSRNFTCSTQSWSEWTTTSDNCTPDPPTCFETSEYRNLTCEAGYTGSILESRSSICSDPYSTPIFGTWTVVTNGCVKSITNPTNVESPVSPISPLNPNSPLVQVTTAPLIPPEPVIAQELTALQTTVETPTTSVATVQVKDTTTTSVTEVKISSNSSGAKVEIKTPEVPKGKELVPGFGLVMSLNLINQSYNMQQQQIEEIFKLEQEQEYGRTQEFTLTLLTETTIGDRFDSLNRSRWTSLLRNHPLQRLELND
ncbi:hypothetical protein UFOVP454_12 [uncultured Caudovirales phage]|uniref:Uncharacterized protein n=1 Tax=uncultured Caudovirales phage TaxID=2100421 RepID=A0A6J5MKL4_9CAUD|nr:hypothetical protein UFOVP454_12 [uncultured Caudovirales phage]